MVFSITELSQLLVTGYHCVCVCICVQVCAHVYWMEEGRSSQQCMSLSFFSSVLPLPPSLLSLGRGGTQLLFFLQFFFPMCPWACRKNKVIEWIHVPKNSPFKIEYNTVVYMVYFKTCKTITTVLEYFHHPLKKPIPNKSCHFLHSHFLALWGDKTVHCGCGC